MRESGQIAEKHKRLMKGISAVSHFWRITGTGAGHVIIDHKMAIPQVLSRLREITNRDWVGSDLRLRKGHTKMHVRFPSFFSKRVTFSSEKIPAFPENSTFL